MSNEQTERILGMKNYLHRPPEYCRFIRSRFLNIDAILDAELRLLEHVTGKSKLAFSFSLGSQGHSGLQARLFRPEPRVWTSYVRVRQSLFRNVSFYLDFR